MTWWRRLLARLRYRSHNQQVLDAYLDELDALAQLRKDRDEEQQRHP